MSLSKDKKKGIDAVIAKINKDFGQNIVDYASKKEAELSVQFYPTPSYEVNLMLGGGVGKGKIVELFGDNSSGKTSLAYETIAYNQKIDPDFVAGIFETEGSFDPAYARMLGVDTDRIIYWDQSKEDKEGKVLTAERGFDILRSAVTSGSVNMIVVNSISGLLTKNEEANDMDKLSIGELAKLMSKVMRIITGICSKNKCSVIFINQLRDKIGVMFGDPSTTTGGRALGFFATQRVRLSRYKLDKKVDPITEEDGIKVHCKVVKNRLAKGNPYKQCDYYVIYGEGIKTIYEIASIADREGLVRKAGAWIYYEDENGEPLTIGGQLCKFSSKKAFLEALESNSELRKVFDDKINELMRSNAIRGVGLSKDDIEEIQEEEEKDKKELSKHVDKKELIDAAADFDNEF